MFTNTKKMLAFLFTTVASFVLMAMPAFASVNPSMGDESGGIVTIMIILLVVSVVLVAAVTLLSKKKKK